MYHKETPLVMKTINFTIESLAFQNRYLMVFTPSHLGPCNAFCMALKNEADRNFKVISSTAIDTWAQCLNTNGRPENIFRKSHIFWGTCPTILLPQRIATAWGSSSFPLSLRQTRESSPVNGTQMSRDAFI